MSKTIDIKKYVEKNNPNVEELVAAYPHVDVWELRKLRAEVARDKFLSSGVVPATMSPKGRQAIQAGWFRPIELNIDLPKVKITRKNDKDTKQYLIISDIHAPYEDIRALNLVLDIGKYYEVDEIIINGDLLDLASLSRFTPSADQPLRFVDERKEYLPIAALIREAFPDKPITYRLGNHDIRALHWIDANATPLQGLYTLDNVDELLGIRDLKFDVVYDEPTVLANNSLLVKHGTIVRKNSGYSVKAEIEGAAMSVIMAHVHRRGVVEFSKTSQQIKNERPWIGIEQGCLCDLNPHYSIPEQAVNWQQGAVLLTVSGGDFEPELLRIDNGRSFVRGKLFKA